MFVKVHIEEFKMAVTLKVVLEIFNQSSYRNLYTSAECMNKNHEITL